MQAIFKAHLEQENILHHKYTTSTKFVLYSERTSRPQTTYNIYASLCMQTETIAHHKTQIVS